MECPECDGKTTVLDTRKFAGAVYRKRKCLSCDYRFTTEESEIDSNDLIITEMRVFEKQRYRNRKKRKEGIKWQQAKLN